MYNDHGARNLCLQTGRWTGVDELAQQYWETSPFVSMGNNPVKFVDLDGRSTGWYVNLDNGNYYSDGVDDGKVYTYRGAKYDAQYAKAEKSSNRKKSFDKVSSGKKLILQRDDKNEVTLPHGGKQKKVNLGKDISSESVRNMVMALAKKVFGRELEFKDKNGTGQESNDFIGLTLKCINFEDGKVSGAIPKNKRVLGLGLIVKGSYIEPLTHIPSLVNMIKHEKRHDEQADDITKFMGMTRQQMELDAIRMGNKGDSGYNDLPESYRKNWIEPYEKQNTINHD
jgi:hypothetical protein